MYKEFFGLNEAPFNLTPDPRFLFLSRRHQEALAALVYGINERKGFILLTGEIGAGKTTLSRSFLNELSHETSNVALILNSFLTDLELLQSINDEFGIPSNSESKKVLIDELNHYLLAENEKGKTNILIIDESQNLSPAVLEQVRMLSNLETENNKLIQIILMGQPELSRILALPELEQLSQRIMVRCHISPLQKDEVYNYIRHRLKVAGAKINLAITPTALNRIYHFSNGIPRKINILCDRILLTAYVSGTFQIDAKIVSSAEKELKIIGVGGVDYHMARKYALAAMLILVFCISIYYGVFRSPRPLVNASNTPTANASLAAIKPPAPAPVATVSPTPAPAQKPVASPKPAEATASPSPAPTATPTPTATPAATPTPGAIAKLADLPTTASLEPENEWVYDANNIVRLSDPDLSLLASQLTAAKLWRKSFKLEDLKSRSKETLLGINMLRIFTKPAIELRSFDAGTSLSAAIHYNLPLILELNDPSKRISIAAVLQGIDGTICTVADPRLGQLRIERSALEPVVKRIVVLYSDPMEMTNLALRQEGESVNALRLFLVEQGVWEGNATRTYNSNMTEALKRFQAKKNLKPTGIMNGPTAAWISSLRESFCPRLSTSGGL